MRGRRVLKNNLKRQKRLKVRGKGGLQSLFNLSLNLKIAKKWVIACKKP